MNIFQETKCKNISKKLWCGILEKFSHNLLIHEVEFIVKVQELGKDKKYHLTFQQVLEVKITSEHPEENWDYIELTEISVEFRENVYIIKCDLWSSGELFLICKEINSIEKI